MTRPKPRPMPAPSPTELKEAVGAAARIVNRYDDRPRPGMPQGCAVYYGGDPEAVARALLGLVGEEGKK